MIIKQTVFILGAGASAPYGFPWGKGIGDRILHELNPEPTDNRKAIDCICKAADNNFSSIELEGFRKTLMTSHEQSIDAFLQYHPEFMSPGKGAIAWILLNAESNNKQLRPSQKHKDQDWYPQLRDLLSTSFDEYQNNKAAFLTFNYDRSLEQFLVTTMRSRQRDKVAFGAWNSKLRQSLPIVHLHGCLGMHPAFTDHNQTGTIAYGEPVSPESVRITCQRIRNVHDEVDLDSDPAFQRAYGLISHAEYIFFMGFAYDERNLRKLRLSQFMREDAEIFGTGMGLTEAERARIQQLSDGKIRARHILPLDCAQFLRQSHAVQAIFERR